MHRFIKSLISLIILFLITGTVFAEAPLPVYNKFKPLKMVFLPDIHLSFNNKDNKILYNESLVIFQDVIKQLNRVKQPDLVIFGGNLTANDDGRYSDMPMFLDMIADLQAKYYTIIGDREASHSEDVSIEDFMEEFDEFNNKQTYWTAEPVEGVLLIGLDSTVKNKQEGYINLDQLFWLDNVLKNNREKFTIITLHHSPILTCDQDKNIWQKYMLKKPDLFMELVNLYPQVKIVLSGHHYNNYVRKINKKLFINCPSIAVYPNMYKMLTVYPDRIEVNNEEISFKQIIKKARNSLIQSDYAKEFNPDKPKSVLKYHKGDKFSRQDVYYFEEQKQGFFSKLF